MTPAAALTQAAMDITPAYAGETASVKITDQMTAAQFADAFKPSNESNSHNGDGTHGWFVTVDITELSAALAAKQLVYNGEAQAPGSTGVTISGTYKYYADESATATTDVPFTIDPSLIFVTYNDGTNDIDPDQVVGADEYKATYTVSETANPAIKTGIQAINAKITSGNVARFTINKATPTVVPGFATLGVTTPNKAASDVVVNGVKGALALTTEYTVSTTASNPTKPVTTLDDIPVKVTLTGDAADNYEFAGAVYKDVEVPVGAPSEATGQYEIKWNLPDNTTVPPTTYPVVSTKGNETEGTIAYTGSSLLTDIKGSLFSEYTPSGATTPQTVNYDSYNVTWYQNGKALVGADGKSPAPVAPGVYTAEFRPLGAASTSKAVGTLKLTVQADLSADVDMNGATPAKLVKVTVDGRAPQKVLLEFKEGMTAKDLVDQVKKTLAVSYKGIGGQTDKMADPASAFSFKVEGYKDTDVVKKAAGKIEMSYAGSDAVFTKTLDITYDFGVAFPTFPELSAVDYNPNGYDPAKLIPDNVKGSDGQTVDSTDYAVQAYATDANGDIVGNALSKLVGVGTYKLVITPNPARDYVGGGQTLAQVIEAMPVSKSATDLQWSGKSLVNGTFTVPYTGSAVEPSVSGTIAVDVKHKDLYDPTPNSFQTTIAIEAIETDGRGNVTSCANAIPTKAVYDTLSAAQKASVAGYVEYANNTQASKDGSVATATITFLNNLSGTLTQNFTITSADLGATSMNTNAEAATQLRSAFNLDNDLTSADVVDPVVTIHPAGSSEKTLEQGVDYKITRTYIASDQTGLAPGVTRYIFDIQGLGNYTGTAQGTFTVSNQKLDAETFVAALAQPNNVYPYELGDPVVPAGGNGGVTVKFRTNTGAAAGQELATDQYRLTYENNKNATTEDAPAYVVVTGVKDYAGTIKIPYQIQPLSLDGASAAKITLKGATGLVYNGKEQKPEVVIDESSVVPSNPGYNRSVDLKEIVDQITYDTYESNVNAGTGYVVVSGKGGNIVGSVKAPFTIAKADVAKAEVAGPKAPVAPGTALADAVVVTLDGVELTADDYTVASEDAVPGAAGVTVTGQGNLTGTKTADVTVLYDVAGLSYKVSSGTYNGQSQTPVVTASYKDASGKTVDVPASALNVAAGSYVNAGKYKIKVAGNAAAGWGGEATVDYTIAPATVTAKPQVSYDAAGLPVVTVPGLTSNDFDWKADAATKTITVTYKGNYAGTATVAYAPTAKPVAPAKPAAGKTGWVGSGNDWAYYEDGQAVKGQWKWIGDAWYHFEKSGKMTNTRWFQDADGTWYLLNQSHKGHYGAMLTGWQKVGKDWYYMNKSGAMQSGWAKVKGEWYLLNTSHDGTYGKMLTGWQQVGGKWYYMDASGAMASNEWVGRYWVNGSGVWTATR